MKIARVAVLGVAVGAGLIAAFIAMRLSAPAPAPIPSSHPEAAAAPVAPTKQVLVATQDIPLGTTLQSDSVKWSDWPATGVSDKFIARDGTPDQLSKVVGSIARASLYAGEPISEGKLIQSDNGFMSAILPSGMRAVATRISADTSAGGFILPNDHVDVIMTRQRSDTTPSPDGNQYTTETILNNVRVLAIDQTIEEIKGEKVVVGQTATLELTPQQAKILSVADQLSDHRLTLALRSIVDSRPLASDAALDATHLLGGTTENGAVTVVRGGVAREVNALRQ
jgi:pilus assembly protein CpaB